MTLERFVLYSVLLIAAPAAAEICNPPDIRTCPQAFLPSPQPYTGDMSAISNAIFNAKEAAKVEDKLRDALLESQAEFRRVYASRSSNIPEKTDSLNNYVNAATKYRDAKKITQEDYTYAIKETIRLFHLTPPNISPDLQPNSPWSSMHSWDPRYSEDEVQEKGADRPRLRTKEELAEEKNSGLGVYASETSPKNGDIRIYRPAFENDNFSAVHLAALIVHETTHWVDTLSTAGNEGSPAERYRLEARAYGAQGDLFRLMAVAELKELKLGAAEEMRVNAAGFGSRSAQYAYQERIASKRHLTFGQIQTDPQYANWLPVNGDSYRANKIPSSSQKAEELDEREIRDAVAALRKDRDLQQRQNALNEEMDRMAQDNRERIAAEDAAQRRQNIDAVARALTPEGQAEALAEAAPVAATPSAVPLPSVSYCIPQLRNIAGRGCNGAVLTQADNAASILCNQAIVANNNYSIQMVQQDLPECERVFLYVWFGEQNLHSLDDAAALNALASKLRWQYNPPQPSNIPDPLPIRRNPTPDPCTRIVTAPSAGISAPHPCQ